jgi:hypothetical protein
MLDTGGVERSDDFYVYFGWLPAERILEVTSTKTGEKELDWGREREGSHLVPGVPFRKRHDWQRRTLRNVHQALTLITATPSGAYN